MCINKSVKDKHKSTAWQAGILCFAQSFGYFRDNWPLLHFYIIPVSEVLNNEAKLLLNWPGS